MPSESNAFTPKTPRIDVPHVGKCTRDAVVVSNLVEPHNMTVQEFMAALQPNDYYTPAQIDSDRLIAVIAVEDDEHYSDRTPGPVHEDTLRIISGWSDKTDWLPEHEDDSD